MHVPTQETRVHSLGREDPLEKETATHSSVLAWRIPWAEWPGGLQYLGLQRVGHDLATERQHDRARLLAGRSGHVSILQGVVTG